MSLATGAREHGSVYSKELPKVWPREATGHLLLWKFRVRCGMWMVQSDYLMFGENSLGGG